MVNNLRTVFESSTHLQLFSILLAFSPPKMYNFSKPLLITKRRRWMEHRIRSARDTVINTSAILKIGLLDSIGLIAEDVISSNSAYLDELKQELSLSAAGKLHIHKRRDYSSFGLQNGNGDAEIPSAKGSELIPHLARKEYSQKRISSLEQDIARLQKLKEVSMNTKERLRFNNKLRRFNDVGIDLATVLFSREQNEWIDEYFTSNPYNRENLSYQTGCGLFVRSKSEAKIARLLESLGLPYRYDDLVKIEPNGSGGVPHRDTYFADFKVPNLLGGITIHEHFGAFQLENYADNALKRLNDYHNFEVYELPGRPVKDSEFTFSFEGNLNSNESLRTMLRKILLPF